MNKQFFSQNSPINSDDMIFIKVKNDNTDPQNITGDMTSKEVTNIFNKLRNDQLVPVCVYYKYIKREDDTVYRTITIPAVVQNYAKKTESPTSDKNIEIRGMLPVQIVGEEVQVNNGLFITITSSGAMSVTVVNNG